MDLKTLIEDRIRSFVKMKFSCGCNDNERVYSGGGTYLCKHFNFAIICPEYLQYWSDSRDPRLFTPYSNKEVLMRCKLNCSTPAYLVKLSLYLRNKGCDGCTGRGRKSVIAFEHSVLSNERMKSLWSPKNTVDPRIVTTQSNKSFIWQCRESMDHEWNATPGSIYRGSGCPRCPSKAVISKEEALRRFEIAHGNRYQYDWSDYQFFSNKMTIICQTHGPFRQSPRSHAAGHNCQMCIFGKIHENLGTGKISFDDVAIRFTKIWGKEYEYIASTYRDTQTPFTILCRKHGPFQKTAFNHLKGQGCPTCRLVDVNDLISRFRKVHGMLYRYHVDSYINTTYPIGITCSRHGVFFKKAHHHLQGQGCPLCSGCSSGVNRIKLYLLLTSLSYETEVWFNELRGYGGLPLKFDIYVPALDLFIEFDGRQHFENIEHWGGEIELQNRMSHDIMKDRFVVERGRSLVRLPYTASPENTVTILNLAISTIIKGLKIYISYSHYCQESPRHISYMWR